MAPLNVTRPLNLCKCCYHKWRQMKSERVPPACPKCRRTDWDRGKDVPSPPKPEAPYCALRETARAEYALFLARRAGHDERNLGEYRGRTTHRRYAAEEIQAADVRPPLMPDGIPFKLARLTLTRRRSRVKKEA
jgi:hypothetical protein